MAKFFGPVGFTVTEETRPGVWKERLREENYYGDVLQTSSRWQNASKVIDDIDISNRISILGDPFAFRNFSTIKYVVWMDQKWKVSSVEVQYPRLILSIGGVYNEG